MKVTPHCNIMYHGEFYRGGVSFDADPEDAEELSQYAEVSQEKGTQKRVGRPRKTEQ